MNDVVTEVNEAAGSPVRAGLLKSAPIKCAYTNLVNPKDLLPHPKNPNKHPPKQIEMFVTILGFQGWRRPITISKLSGFVTKGHGALEAALHAGCDLVPVDSQDYDNEQQELADIVADNQLQRMSEMDNVKLTQLLVQLDSGKFNMELTGLDTGKLEKILVGFEAPQHQLAGGEGAPVGAPGEPGSPESGAVGVEATSQIRMVQLFLNEQTQAEFMTIVEFFQKELSIDNVTDAVMEVLRSAFRAHTESNGADALAEAGPADVPASESNVE